MRKIYLDYAATTPLDERVLKEMAPYFSEQFGNPMSGHSFGQEALVAIDKARQDVADFLGAKISEVVFTSGATESNNLTIKGVIKNFRVQNSGIDPHIITTVIEHHSVLETCQALEREGVEVTYLKVNREGLVDTSDLKKELKKNTALISIMVANNEVGTIEPVKEIGEMVCQFKKENNSPYPFFHTDATQAIGYLNIKVDEIKADLLSFSGHKICGPKGIGGLYVRKGTKINRIQDGGEQEYKLRAGTHNVPSIIGIAKAMMLINKEREEEVRRVRELRDVLEQGIKDKIEEVMVNGSGKNRLPGNLNVTFKGVEGESIMLNLDFEGIAVSTGSACSSSSLKPSHVLRALGLKDEEAHGSIRFSLGKQTSKEDVDYVLEVLPAVIERLRKISGFKK